jgi:hypothetical protein
MTTIYNFKRGSTLSLGGTVQLPSGTWTATAQVKDSSLTLVEGMNVTLTPPVAPSTLHTIVLEAHSTMTNDWPIDSLQCDIRFADASTPPVVLDSTTFVINVQQEITSGN